MIGNSVLGTREHRIRATGTRDTVDPKQRRYGDTVLDCGCDVASDDDDNDGTSNGSEGFEDVDGDGLQTALTLTVTGTEQQISRSALQFLQILTQMKWLIILTVT